MGKHRDSPTICRAEDSDTDGVMDWFEMYQFGSLSLGQSDDPDGDGFSNKREDELGQEATIHDQVEDGGISSRVSTEFSTTIRTTSMQRYQEPSLMMGSWMDPRLSGHWMRMILWSPSRPCPMGMVLLKFRCPSLHPMILRCSSMPRAMETHREPPRGNIISTGMHRLVDLIVFM